MAVRTLTSLGLACSGEGTGRAARDSFARPTATATLRRWQRPRVAFGAHAKTIYRKKDDMSRVEQPDRARRYGRLLTLFQLATFLAVGTQLVLGGATAEYLSDVSQSGSHPRGRVENIWGEEAAVLVVHVFYDLVADDPQTVFNVTLQVALDGGQTFGVTATSVSGDVGPGVRPGIGKRIVWQVGQDVERLAIERFAYRIVLESADPSVVLSEELTMKADFGVQPASVAFDLGQPTPRQFSWSVGHDHYGSEFDNNCEGTLYIGDGRIGFDADYAAHDWELSLADVTDVSRTSGYGDRYKAFYVELFDGAVYHYYAAAGDNNVFSRDDRILSEITAAIAESK